MVEVQQDVQKDALYAFEAKWRDWNRKTSSLAECRQYVHTACAHFGIPPPSVRSHGGKAYSWYQAETPDAVTHTLVAAGKFKSVISFNRTRGLNVPTALHEAAHAIAAVILPWDMVDHDPRFVGIYLWLLIKARIAPRVALEASLTAAGIKWIKPKIPKKRGPEAP